MKNDPIDALISVDDGVLCAEAHALGCQFECARFNQQPDRWYWSYGRHARSSNDHYGLSFDSAGAAAAHFLNSREGRAARHRVNK